MSATRGEFRVVLGRYVDMVTVERVERWSCFCNGDVEDMSCAYLWDSNHLLDIVVIQKREQRWVLPWQGIQGSRSPPPAATSRTSKDMKQHRAQPAFNQPTPPMLWSKGHAKLQFQAKRTAVQRWVVMQSYHLASKSKTGGSLHPSKSCTHSIASNNVHIFVFWKSEGTIK